MCILWLRNSFNSTTRVARAAVSGESLKDIAVDRSDERAWKQGYQLAEELLAGDRTCDRERSPIAIEQYFEHFVIFDRAISLHDRSARAVALAAPITNLLCS